MSQAQGTGGFPGSLPFTELYLVMVDGQWPIYASSSALHAISDVERKQGEGRVRVWRVTSLEVEQLTVQREVIRKALVPYGSEVTK